MKYYFNDSYLNTKPWKRVLLIIGLTLVIGYVLFMGAYFVTSEPSFCSLCHNLTPYYLSWKESPHSDVKCLYCHEFRGFVGKLHSKTRGLNFVYQQLTGQYTILTKALIFEQNCIACHLGDYYNYPETKRLNNKHYEFIKADRSCLPCHREIGHNTDMFSKAKFQ